ncbi:uncharacterized protein LOC131169360 [Hevea brasiliensis]|uniref:uncharacterized protein LOC131169360 n=1 Tax=Hevea brasiliensis TaxID=3981 RepID=UPI0025D8C7A6|nr:uncharacterized protein LOC131169360 [Hevea brasiliensis]
MQRFPLERLQKYGVIDFKGKKEDDPAAAEYWLEWTERVLQQLHCIVEQQLECALALLQEEANVVADALSRKAIMALRALNVHLSLVLDGTILVELCVKPCLLQQIQEAQIKDEKLMSILGRVKKGKQTDYELKEDGCLYYKGKICVPGDE